MCLLLVAKERKLTKTEFYNSWDSNSDGVGIGYFKPDGTKFYRKGLMNLANAWQYYREHVNKLPHTVHFRLTSHGGTCKKLTHPFVIGEDQSKPNQLSTDSDLLFHNGVFTEYKQFLLGLACSGVNVEEPYSDTSIIAMSVYRLHKAGLSYDNIYDELIETGGKYVIMTNGMFRHFGDFHDNNGILFSNHSYKYQTIITPSWKYGQKYKGGANTKVPNDWYDQYYDDTYDQYFEDEIGNSSIYDEVSNKYLLEQDAGKEKKEEKENEKEKWKEELDKIKEKLKK